MSTYQPSVFNQIFRLIQNHITPLVGQLNKYAKTMNVQSLLKVLLFSQITWKDSLREIETAFECNITKLYHMWIKTKARSTIAYWNNKVDASVFEQLFYTLLSRYKSCFANTGDSIWIPTVILDSTLISLALHQFSRAKHRTTKWGIRVHVWLELQDCIPRFILIKNAKKVDNIVAKQLVSDEKIKAWEIIIFDRYYVDFNLRSMIDERKAFFTTRTKTNTDYVVIQEHNIHEAWVIKDATIELLWHQWRKKYCKPLRIVRFYDSEQQRDFEFITNNFDLSAWTIAQSYKYRWRIEEFFRWIKQNLKIKSFLWTSENAVKNQIRVAMIYYLIMQYLRYTAKLWKNQILKLIRIIREKCLFSIGLSEIFVLCKSKSSLSLSSNIWPPWSLFDF
jgi:hypothetical protein